MNDEVWQAILGCDRTYDGKFFYGVKSTGIYCRPSCKSRAPKRNNVMVFSTAMDAVSAQFRPCKRCRPDQIRLPDAELAASVISVIETRYREPLSLSSIADDLHMSPYHLHRTFKRVTGVTPAQHIRNTRLTAAKEKLLHTGDTISNIALAVGFPNAAHFATVFYNYNGVSPSTFRNLHEHRLSDSN